jgi:FkbM family methyltransferase
VHLMARRMTEVLQTLRFLLAHPLSSAHPAESIARWLRWQIGSRVVGADVVVPFVDDTRLVVRRGMSGATGNVYAGLHEFADMSFLLHLLGPDDLFVDIGANVGTYSVLAAGVRKARCLALEPDDAAFKALCDNIAMNRIGSLVDARQMGAGRVRAELPFTVGLDTTNHVVARDEVTDASTRLVPVDSLDAILEGSRPTLIKMDVEGFERDVLEGAPRCSRRAPRWR